MRFVNPQYIPPVYKNGTLLFRSKPPCIPLLTGRRPLSPAFTPRCGSSSLRFNSTHHRPKKSGNEVPELENFEEEPITLPATRGWGFMSLQPGDVLGPRNQYRILRKLGWGMYSNVWLAKDHIKNRYVALKALTSYMTHLIRGEVQNQPRHDELDIIRRISEDTDSPGAKHCVRLVDHFDTESHFGAHICLVTNVYGYDIDDLRLSMPNKVLSIPLTKRVMKQVLLALDYLHRECGVIHTDLKPDNVMIKLDPSLLESHIEHVLRTDPTRGYPPREVNGVSVRAVVTQPLPIPKPVDINTIHIAVGDFGAAQWVNQRATDEIQPFETRAPEAILGLPWNEKVDIWSAACMTFELLVGTSLFHPKEASDREDDLLARHMKRTREVFTTSMIQGSKRGKEFFDDEGKLRRVEAYSPLAIGQAMVQSGKIPDRNDLHEAAIFIKRCLRLNPDDRPSAAELLKDEWLKGVY